MANGVGFKTKFLSDSLQPLQVIETLDNISFLSTTNTPIHLLHGLLFTHSLHSALSLFHTHTETQPPCVTGTTFGHLEQRTLAEYIMTGPKKSPNKAKKTNKNINVMPNDM